MNKPTGRPVGRPRKQQATVNEPAVSERKCGSRNKPAPRGWLGAPRPPRATIEDHGFDTPPEIQQPGEIAIPDEPIRQNITISDTHLGCRYGLFAGKKLRLDSGGYYEPSDGQKKVAMLWEFFWNDWVPIVTRGERYSITLDGDIMDGRHHRSVTQISQNLADQYHLALETLYPIVERCGYNMFFVRGTEAHTGPDAENEEILAQALHAIPDTTGHYSRYALWLRIGERLASFMHHIGTTSRTQAEAAALTAEVVEELVEASRFGNEAPDWVIRAHRHRFLSVTLPTDRAYAICATTPAWQLMTPFGFKTAARTKTPMFGGLLLRCGNEEHYIRAFAKTVKRDAPASYENSMRPIGWIPEVTPKNLLTLARDLAKQVEEGGE